MNETNWTTTGTPRDAVWALQLVFLIGTQYADFIRASGNNFAQTVRKHDRLPLDQQSSVLSCKKEAVHTGQYHLPLIDSLAVLDGLRQLGAICILDRASPPDLYAPNPPFRPPKTGAQLSGRALPSHGRGHRFNPCRAHHILLNYQAVKESGL